MNPTNRPRNASTAMAQVFLDELTRCGVTEVVLAPGSRSAPLAFAAYAAAREHGIRLHTRVDERSGAFLALGMAKTSLNPVVVITTSGTAVANLHPAVLEATHAGVPLIVLTADRPASLRGTNANQATDQVKIFGNAVRAFADVPPAWTGQDERQGERQDERQGEARQVAGWRSLVARTVATATGSGATARGPAHLNLQFEEPLTPDVDGGWAADCAGRDGPWMVTVGPAPAQLHVIERGPRTVVVAGEDAGPPARILAESAGWPLLAEPTSGARTGANAIRAYRLLLGDPGLTGRIERVVLYGHPTLSRPITGLLSRSDVDIIAVTTPTGWTDPGHRVAKVVHGLRLDGPENAPKTPTTPWLREWLDRDVAVCAALDELLEAQGELTPHHVAAAVSAALPPGGLLFVGASNPVRDLDLMVASYPVGERRLTIGNRGLAGIDGTVSSAIGAALGRRGTSRALALMGDITFLHDTNGLLLGLAEERPDLMIVVVNDDGGSIFSALEQGAQGYADSYDKLFGTPQTVDLAALCAATKTPHRRVSTVQDLSAAIDRPAGGIEVLEAVVRRDNRRELDARIRALVTSRP